MGKYNSLLEIPKLIQNCSENISNYNYSINQLEEKRQELINYLEEEKKNYIKKINENKTLSQLEITLAIKDFDDFSSTTINSFDKKCEEIKRNLSIKKAKSIAITVFYIISIIMFVMAIYNASH